MLDSAYADYNRMPGIRWTVLAAMAKSPAHYVLEVARVSSPDVKETEDRRLGRAIHCLTLEGDDVFGCRWVSYEGTRDKRHAKYQAFLAEHPGAEVLSVKEMRLVKGMARSLQRHPVVIRYLETGVREAPLTWRDVPTGLQCKARPDLLTPHRLLDLKSGQRMDEFGFTQTAQRLGYHCQMAHYMDGLLATGWNGSQEPILLGVERTDPFDVVPYEMPHAILMQGRRIVRRLLDRVAECDQRGEWPGRAPRDVVRLNSAVEWRFAGMYDDLSDLDMSGLERE